MTPDEIAARNRANAQKSTGPKTARGRAMVAGNARRHGATARPNSDSIIAWLAILLERPEITPDDLLPGDEVGEQALALAEAEAALGSAEAALWAFEAGDVAPSESLRDLREQADRLAEDLANRGRPAAETRAALSFLRQVAHVEAEEIALEGSRHRLLRRYVREARARRGRAFRAWVAGKRMGARRSKMTNSRNEPIIHA